MLIRDMTMNDIDSVLEIELSSSPVPWKRFVFEFELQENAAAYYWVCEIDGEVVAYSGAWFVGTLGTIMNIAVLPDYRGRGIGTKLFEEMLDYCHLVGTEEFRLEVRVSNERAISLYERMGFVKKSIKENFYEENNEDAFLMALRT